MNQIDRNKIMKMAAVILLIFVAVGIASFFHRKNSITLDEYAKNHPELTGPPSDASENAVSGNTVGEDASAGDVSSNNPADGSDVSGNGADSGDAATASSTLTGALLNGGADGQAMLAERVTYRTDAGLTAKDFYYEPLSENLKRYITGVSYPGSDQTQSGQEEQAGQAAQSEQATQSEQTAHAGQAASNLAIDYSELRYVHVLHYDFTGAPAEGELICNAAIAEDLLDIFYELYRNEYQIEKIRLIDEYDGDDTASMEDNNTSCFNYRVVEGSTNLSKHAYGLAIDVNPFYNPYITYNKDGTEHVSPIAAEAYADRGRSFPYKIDENDLCYRLFTEHGFTWGGNWNSCKDYQHFQKTPAGK